MEQGRNRVRWARIAVWYGAVWAVGYGLGFLFRALGSSFDDASWVLFAQLSALTPAIVSLVLTRWLWRAPVRESLALRLRCGRWLLVAWGLGWAVCLLALALGLAVPGVHWDGSLQPAVDARLLAPGQLDLLRRLATGAGVPPALLLVPMGVLLSLTMSFVAGCGEEIGWRGFLHGELRPLGFWRNALLTGLLWLAWHVPVLLMGWAFPRHPGLGALLLSSHVLVTSVGAAYLRERAASSLAVGLFHGTTEAAMLLAVAPLAGGTELTVGVASVTWVAADVLVVAALLAHDRLVAREPLTGRRAPRPRLAPPA